MTTMAMLSNDSERRTGLRQTGPAPGRVAKTAAGSGNRAAWALARQSRYGPSTRTSAAQTRLASLTLQCLLKCTIKHYTPGNLLPLSCKPSHRRCLAGTKFPSDNDSCKEKCSYDTTTIQNITTQYTSLYMSEFTGQVHSSVVFGISCGVSSESLSGVTVSLTVSRPIIFINIIFHM